MKKTLKDGKSSVVLATAKLPKLDDVRMYMFMCGACLFCLCVAGLWLGCGWAVAVAACAQV